MHRCYDPFIIITNFFYCALKTILYLYGVSFSFLNLKVSLLTLNKGIDNLIFKVSSENGKNHGSNKIIPAVILLSIYAVRWTVAAPNEWPAPIILLKSTFSYKYT